jgi:hypothetical protein
MSWRTSALCRCASVYTQTCGDQKVHGQGCVGYGAAQAVHHSFPEVDSLTSTNSTAVLARNLARALEAII